MYMHMYTPSILKGGSLFQRLKETEYIYIYIY